MVQTFHNLTNTLRHSLSSRSLGARFRSEDAYKQPNNSGPIDSAYGSGESVFEPDDNVSRRYSDVSSLSNNSLGTLSNSSIESLKHPMPQRVYLNPASAMDSTGVSNSVEEDDSNHSEASATDMPFGLMPFGQGRPGAGITSSGSAHTPSATAPPPPRLYEYPDDYSVLSEDSDDSSTISADSDIGHSLGRAPLEPIQESSDEQNYSAPLGPVLGRGPDYSQTSLGSSRASSLHRTHSVHGRPRSRRSSARSNSGGISQFSTQIISNIDQEIDPEVLRRISNEYWDDPYADTTVDPAEEYRKTLRERFEQQLAAQNASDQITHSPPLPVEERLDDHHSANDQATATSRSSVRSRFASFFSGFSRPSFIPHSASDMGSRLFRRYINSRPFQLPGKGRLDAWKNRHLSSRSSTISQENPRTCAEIEADMYGQITPETAREKYQNYVSQPNFSQTSGSSHIAHWISQLPNDHSAFDADEYNSESSGHSPTSEDDWFSHIKPEEPTTLQDALSEIREQRRKTDEDLAREQSQKSLYPRYWGTADEAEEQPETEDERKIRSLYSQIITLQERLSEEESRAYRF
ncbi:hypothetical protein I302_100332 [Kwoniella bestiolae CBS 10118]|uniref:Uncharacterized protein n=1 Tax=Kwoniella bestiolae CBS 10118 TaxID=1296100 RepID=A0A1B9G4Q7_9TREE|nr:hypothetical protein I302_03704 [Kwoniella bestiolae CBS 10118]OCF26027.1 hypothetical protein I302_03704 [Kwoniella bestiolae CBS 10118]